MDFHQMLEILLNANLRFEFIYKLSLIYSNALMLEMKDI
jgi:hypothetical protein